jgi:hypothetical protein
MTGSLLLLSVAMVALIWAIVETALEHHRLALVLLLVCGVCILVTLVTR